MAVFYTGPRPVTKGRNSNDNVHTWKGTVGTYSNWSIFNSSHVLDGAPDAHHEPGDGRHPGNVTLSRRFRGLDTLNPLDNSGGGERLDWGRFHPYEYKGLTSGRAFSTNFGHAERETDYSIDTFSVAYKFPVMETYGHAVRGVDAAGTANTFGRFAPYVYKGATAAALSEDGYGVPTTYDNEYGRNRVNEWRGVPSAQIL